MTTSEVFGDLGSLHYSKPQNQELTRHDRPRHLAAHQDLQRNPV